MDLEKGQHGEQKPSKSEVGTRKYMMLLCHLGQESSGNAAMGWAGQLGRLEGCAADAHPAPMRALRMAGWGA